MELRGPTVPLSPWRKSSHSGSNGGCVEVTLSPEAAGVRDTKDRDGGTLQFTAPNWRAFAAHLTVS
jgi:hypothetical protein